MKNEIEKELAALEAENEALRLSAHFQSDDDVEANLRNQVYQLSLENERLKAENETLSDNVVYMVKTLEQLQLENERLKEYVRINFYEKIEQLQADKAELLKVLKSCKEEVMFQSSGYAHQVYIICDLLLSKHEAK